MGVTTITSREFNQDTGGAKRAAERGPVLITDRGQPAHVLMRYDDYRRLTAPKSSLVEALTDTSVEGDFDTDFPKWQGAPSRPVDLDD